LANILILGGTTEAATLAWRLASKPGVRAITSLAGRTRQPVTVPGEMRIGGFGGVERLKDYLCLEGIDLLVDATHPFAARISKQAAEACNGAGVPRLMLVRPAWERQDGDSWIEVDSMEAAARALPEQGARVFLTVGRQELEPFGARPDLWFLVRLIEAPKEPLPFPRHELIRERGPFALEDEAQLLARRGIDFLVTKNAGGQASAAKIQAARSRGLPVVMVRRPRLPLGDATADVDGAMAWISARLAQ